MFWLNLFAELSSSVVEQNGFGVFDGVVCSTLEDQVLFGDFDGVGDFVSSILLMDAEDLGFGQIIEVQANFEVVPIFGGDNEFDVGCGFIFNTGWDIVESENSDSLEDWVLWWECDVLGDQ